VNLLEKFFGDVGAQEFLRHSWPGEVRVQDGDLARLGEIGAVPEFHDIELLLRNLPGHIDLVHRDGKRVIIPKAVDALPSYRDGIAMLYLKDLETLPAIFRACDELAALLAIPRHFVSCEGFAAIGTVNVPLHFDHETNFMVQVRGDKTWVFAKNEDLPDPIFPYFPGNPNRFYDDGRNPFTGARLPCEAPAWRVQRVVHAGTVTFMPRGFWHSTCTHEESFAIGFVINPPTMAEIALSAVLARLHADGNFRAHPLTANTLAGREELLQRFGRLLDAASDVVGGLRPETLLSDYLTRLPGNGRSLNHPR
jgi:hypothetical protein